MDAKQNLENMKQGYKDFAEGNLDAIRDRFSPDIIFHVPGNNQVSGDYKGVDDVFGFFGKLIEGTNGTFKIDPHDFLANEDHGVAIVTTSGERDGKSLSMKTVHVWNVDAEGKLTENWTFVEDQATADDFWGS